MGALEHDTNDLYRFAGHLTPLPSAPPPATALIDAAIDHFSLSVFEQPVKIQESAISQVAACIGDSSLARNAGRKAAVVANIVVALSKAVSTLTPRATNSLGLNERVISSLIEVLHVLLFLRSY